MLVANFELVRTLSYQREYRQISRRLVNQTGPIDVEMALQGSYVECLDGVQTAAADDIYVKHHVAFHC